MRTTIVRGTGRWQYVAGKLLLIVGALLVALTAVAAATAVSSRIAVAVVEAPPGGGSEAAWSDAALAVLKTTYGVIPLVAFVALITVLTASSATGMAAGIGYYIAEPILTMLLGSLFGWFEEVAQYLPVSTINAWSGAAAFGPGGAEGAAVGAQEFVVLLVCAVVFIGADSLARPPARRRQGDRDVMARGTPIEAIGLSRSSRA